MKDNLLKNAIIGMCKNCYAKGRYFHCGECKDINHSKSCSGGDYIVCPYGQGRIELLAPGPSHIDVLIEKYVIGSDKYS